MQRTISVMVGKGSVKHNSRAFHAANTDPERSGLNRSYCNDDIRKVYRDLFDDALMRYNEKQTRSDRVIDDYYEKICSGKQEKPFHEIILQIGNCEDMSSKTENGELAMTMLDEYMQTFQVRNPNLRVFSAHLHMDEATPHLHIDFVPFTTGSKRGLATRVSLKQALAEQGFSGGSRQDTEWNQWVASEKEQLAKVMEYHGIEWLQKGTHEKHLSVLDYEKKMRTKEVAELEIKVDNLVAGARGMQEYTDGVQERLAKLERDKNVIDLNAHKFDTDPEWQLPEPAIFMTANTYKTKIVAPLFKKFKNVIKSLIARCLQFERTVDDLKRNLSRAYSNNDVLIDKIEKSEQNNAKLTGISKDYKRLRDALGAEQTDRIIVASKAAEQVQKKSSHQRSHCRSK